MSNATRVSRVYGAERTFGDILYNPQTKSVFTRIDLGAFSLSLTLVLRSDGGYDVLKPYTAKDGSNQVVNLGRTFLATRKDGSVVEGITKGSLGLYREYDATLQKELTRSNDALFFTTHKLQTPKLLGESGLKKVGWITGQFGIEVVKDAKDGDNGSYQAPEPEIVYDDEEIPF